MGEIRVDHHGIQALFVEKYLKSVEFLDQVENEGDEKKEKNDLEPLPASQKGMPQQEKITGNGYGRYDVYDVDEKEGIIVDGSEDGK